MKRVTLEQLPQEIAHLIMVAQRERVVVTRNGEPYALIVGVENKDEEDLALEFSPAFWRMIEKTRASADSIPLEEVMAELEADEKRCRDEDSETPVKP
jgi:prevent-host-death family protein